MQILARDLFARAAYLKALHAKAPTSKRLATRGPVTTPEETVRRIADDMIDLAGVNGAAEETDLLNRGWSIQALRKYGPEARERANRAVVRRVS